MHTLQCNTMGYIFFLIVSCRVVSCVQHPLKGYILILHLMKESSCWSLLMLTASGQLLISGLNSNSSVVDSLWSVFATYVLPKLIISDNTMSFMSKKFQQFCSKNGIKHITGPTFNPQNYVHAEIIGKVLKQKVATMKQKQITLQQSQISQITNFLMSYRNAPHLTTGQRPCMIMFNRALRTDWISCDHHLRILFKQIKEDHLRTSKT